MEEEINDERGTSDADLPIAIQRNVTNRQLNRKAFLIYPTLPKGKNIDREIKYIQKKFSAIRIDLKCHKMGLSKSKKRRLRRKRQERARLNKGTPDMNKVAANPVLVGNTESKNDGIKNQLNVKINILARETREVNKNVSILYPNNSKQGSDTVSRSPNKLASEIIAETNKSNENKSIFSSNESEHEKDSRLSSRKRKKNEHSSKSANLFPTPSFKTAKENEMSAQSTTETVCLSKINESFAHRNLNNELSTLKLVESKHFTKNANIFASSSSKSTNHNESIEKLKKTEDASKSKSETSSKKYKLVKLATKTDIDSKYLFQPIKVAKLSAEHSMDTKMASQSKSKFASSSSKSTNHNESIEKRRKTEDVSKSKSKTSPKKYKPATLAPIDVTEPKNVFQPIKVAKLSAEHNMDTKVTDQSKSKLTSNNSKIPKIDNGLSAQKPQRTKRFSKRRRKISPNTKSGVAVDLVIDKIKSRELFYYSIEVTDNLNLLRTNDIFFMLNIQNSLPTKDWIFIKRKEIIKGKSEISFVFDRVTLTSLEKMQFKASVLRSTVTFVEYVFKKAFLDIFYEPFDWLGDWSCFKTVLNKNEVINIDE